MFDVIRRHLGVKLFLSYLGVILAGALILALATAFSLPRAYNRHLAGMEQVMQNGGMEGMQGLGQGRGQLGQGPGMMRNLYANFRASFVEALSLAAIAALLVAVAVSLILSRSVVAPVRAMQLASQRIAAGHYAERVQAGTEDELGRLAQSFNHMAGELEQVETMRRRLIGDVAHELRTPLTAIQGSAEGLMDGVLPATTETYQQIYQESTRLARLVDDLQELSRVEARAYELDCQPLGLAAVVKTVSKRMGSSFADRQLTFAVDLPVDLPRVRADEGRLVQIVTNLVGNALQYTPAGGTITFKAVLLGEEVQVSVQDTGVGIPPEHLPHIFDRFYRVDKSRSRAHGGSGIGLTIARYLVEAHGGRIWVESAGQNLGSTFFFTLPVAA